VTMVVDDGTEMGSTPTQPAKSPITGATPAARSYRWGTFQSAMSVPLGIVVLISAYKYTGPWRVINTLTALIYFVVCVGLANKKRYGLFLYYVLVLFALGNYARTVTIILLRRPASLTALPPLPFLLVSLLIALWWIVPAVFYYPKRWKEFS